MSTGLSDQIEQRINAEMARIKELSDEKIAEHNRQQQAAKEQTQQAPRTGRTIAQRQEEDRAKDKAKAEADIARRAAKREDEARKSELAQQEAAKKLNDHKAHLKVLMVDHKIPETVVTACQEAGFDLKLASHIVSGMAGMRKKNPREALQQEIAILNSYEDKTEKAIVTALLYPEQAQTILDTLNNPTPPKPPSLPRTRDSSRASSEQRDDLRDARLSETIISIVESIGDGLASQDSNKRRGGLEGLDQLQKSLGDDGQGWDAAVKHIMQKIPKDQIANLAQVASAFQPNVRSVFQQDTRTRNNE